jgi:hypothetical protein
MCSVTGCPNASNARGLCKSHYARLLRGKPLNAPMRPKRASLESLRKHLEEHSTPGPNGCVDWTLSTRTDGYGQILVDGRHTGVHRVAYELTGKVIPPGLLILHSCDRPICINPAHLRVGTHAENTEDAFKRGRRTPPGAKITFEQAETIRVRYAAGGITQRALGAEYGITPSAVSMIISGHNWSSPRRLN